MMHITEDTPPDMLEGAMDLTVHLPNGKAVKMSVERSTPMMDVLVQITTAHQLQISNYAIHALGMAPLSGHTDNILPFKANTPIGTLETQHIKVVPKNRSVSASRVAPTTQQPFESTFRLKVHLPRNQLYVHRVSKSTNLGQIMRKVCDEKNLDPEKYEFRHPGNLDEVLDPKLTLADYQITEIYAVLKGAARLSQTFSAQDIMALRKEDDRKNSKSSGGVFSMFFKRGKSNSGSLSSENRSISPSHSDDSRSGTPPATQPPLDKPKPPQRKRRPAPKPPQIKEESKKVDHPVTICHSRNSSDSSGYHEASILSDANASLPRRPQILNEESRRSINGEFSRSTGNLATMSNQSKSTSSLALAGRKKKAPPPPPKSGAIDNASPVVASRVEKQDLPSVCMDLSKVPVPLPRNKIKAPGATSSDNYARALETIHVDLFNSVIPLVNRRNSSFLETVNTEDIESKDKIILVDNDRDGDGDDSSDNKKEFVNENILVPKNNVEILNVENEILQTEIEHIANNEEILINNEGVDDTKSVDDQNPEDEDIKATVINNKLNTEEEFEIKNLEDVKIEVFTNNNKESLLNETQTFDSNIEKSNHIEDFKYDDNKVDKEDVSNIESKSCSIEESSDKLQKTLLDNEEIYPSHIKDNPSKKEISMEIEEKSSKIKERLIKIEENFYQLKENSTNIKGNFSENHNSLDVVEKKTSKEDFSSNEELLIVVGSNEDKNYQSKLLSHSETSEVLSEIVDNKEINKIEDVSKNEEPTINEECVKTDDKTDDTINDISHKYREKDQTPQIINSETVNDSTKLPEEISVNSDVNDINVKGQNPEGSSLELSTFLKDFQEIETCEIDKVDEDNFDLKMEGLQKKLEEMIKNKNREKKIFEDEELKINVKCVESSTKDTSLIIDEKPSAMEEIVLINEDEPKSIVDNIEIHGKSSLGKENQNSNSETSEVVPETIFENPENDKRAPLQFSETINQHESEINDDDKNNNSETSEIVPETIFENPENDKRAPLQFSETINQHESEINDDDENNNSETSEIVPETIFDNPENNNRAPLQFSETINQQGSEINDDDDLYLEHRILQKNRSLPILENSFTLRQKPNEENQKTFRECRSDMLSKSSEDYFGFGPNIKKWQNCQNLDEITSNTADSGAWLLGDSDTDSIVTTPPLPNSVNIADKITIPTTNSPPESIASSLSTTLSSNIETDILPSNDEDNKITTPKEICPSPTKSSKISNLDEVDNPRGSIQKRVEVQEELQTWQYQLPSPPNAFRDDSPVVTEQTPTDSIITSPELFEKLKLVKETQSETSEIHSVASENDMYNTLSLENLEKRKSLVYNRELATSFKYSEEQVDPKKFENANNVINELEEVLANKPEKVKVNNSTTLITNSRVESRNLPNFKITTYNEPKKNINIFEDDSIRSNANDSKLKKHISMENLALRRESLDDSKKPSQDFNKYRSKTLARMNEGLARSESLTRNTWVPMNPVKRSKSQVAINYHQQQSEEEEEEEDKTNNNGLSKSNSLFDVSGLQSLEVMRKIQTTLNSTEALEENKAFKSGPPSINLGTWSDRSRSNVSSRNESTNINNKNNNNVSIKINGSESISTRSGGNVIIKIGGETNVQLRKPLDDVKNTVERDMSRVPIVRSVELKKPFRDFHPNKSVTQICPEEDVKSLNYIMNSNNNKMNRKNSFNDVGYKTLPSKNVTKSENFSTNMNVPFSQCILRRTDSVNKLESNNNNSSNNNNNNSNNKSNIFGNVVLRSASNANNFSKRYSTGNLDNMYSQKLTPPLNSVTPRPVTQSSQRITLESTQRTIPESTQRTIVVSTEHTMGPPLQTKIRPLSQTIPRPPAPPTLPKQRPPSVTIDPRGQLLSDIINFGGKKGLRTLNN